MTGMRDWVEKLSVDGGWAQWQSQAGLAPVARADCDGSRLALHPWLLTEPESENPFGDIQRPITR